MNKVAAKVTKIEHCDDRGVETFLLLPSQVSQLTDKLFAHALIIALQNELAAVYQDKPQAELSLLI